MQARRVNHTVFSTAVIKHKNRGAARYFSSNLCAYKFKEDVCVCVYQRASANIEFGSESTWGNELLRKVGGYFTSKQIS